MSSGRSAKLPATPTSHNSRHIDPSATNNGYPTNINAPKEPINALGTELAAATSQVIDSLSDHEKQIIIKVLNRDENVRQRDAARIM